MWGMVSAKKREDGRSQAEDVYGDIFAGRTKVKLSNHLSIREYPSVLEFADAVKKIRRENIALYSADYKRANRILRDYFPDAYGERMLLAYPVGRFVGVLNRMWEEELGSVVLGKKGSDYRFFFWMAGKRRDSGKRVPAGTDRSASFFPAGAEHPGSGEQGLLCSGRSKKKCLPLLKQKKEAEESIARWRNQGEPACEIRSVRRGKRKKKCGACADRTAFFAGRSSCMRRKKGFVYPNICSVLLRFLHSVNIRRSAMRRNRR